MNVRLRWVLPTPSSRQRPIARTDLFVRVSDQLPWTKVNEVAAPGVELLVENVDPGTWSYGATVVDVDNRESAMVTTTANVGSDGPSPVSGFTATPE